MSMARSMTDPADPTLTLAQLERAINRARQAQPSLGHESSLNRDVALLGHVYGRLIWRQRSVFRRSDLDRDEQEALTRWFG